MVTAKHTWPMDPHVPPLVPFSPSTVEDALAKTGKIKQLSCLLEVAFINKTQNLHPIFSPVSGVSYAMDDMIVPVFWDLRKLNSCR